MKPCCEKEAKAHIHKKRDVARCDECGCLILGYGNSTDYQKMIRELEGKRIPFETMTLGSLYVVVKKPRMDHG
ncbi:MAG: hypothetical protein HYS08_00750 [Chlamydiae bacterium]|nr:hypothetical protein [Chlamydiota bacterium]MBI3265902.1 hypothetical protein [Chlamydiota bacterium]